MPSSEQQQRGCIALSAVHTECVAKTQNFIEINKAIEKNNYTILSFYIFILMHIYGSVKNCDAKTIHEKVN